LVLVGVHKVPYNNSYTTVYAIVWVEKMGWFGAGCPKQRENTVSRFLGGQKNVIKFTKEVQKNGT
jgi:hypothetical protein